MLARLRLGRRHRVLRARDIQHHSDIDIVFLPRSDLPREFFSNLAEDIEESSIPYHVDLVDLSRAAKTLVDEARREGVRWGG